jgi:uncharacterized RDD family membrane protein YckC
LLLAKASFWQRAGATILDGIIFLPVSFIVACLFASVGGTGAMFITLLASVPAIVYQLIMVSRGQTLGDRATSIRILDSEGNAPGIERSLKRYGIQIAITVGSALLNLGTGSLTNPYYGSTTGINGSRVYNFSSDYSIALFILGALNLFIFVGYIWMAWDPNKQTLFDKIAGTYVVKTL